MIQKTYVRKDSGIRMDAGEKEVHNGQQDLGE
jgi:hypothetical protein